MGAIHLDVSGHELPVTSGKEQPVTNGLSLNKSPDSGGGLTWEILAYR